MKRKMVVTAILLGIAGLIVLAWAWGVQDKSDHREKRKDRKHFYFGMPAEPVYSKSVVTSHQSMYAFDPVLQFDHVKHDFIVKNTTGQTLEIKKVEACCGSLVESYSRQIPSGASGVVQTVLLTDRRGGKEINGTIRLETNDPAHPVWTIDIRCYVKKFADISIYKIMLNGKVGDTVAGTSVIMPSEDYPFNILGLKARKGLDITCSYKTIEQDGRKGYAIRAESTREKPGHIRDAIYVQTDNPQRPEFMIRIQGRIDPA